VKIASLLNDPNKQFAIKSIPRELIEKKIDNEEFSNEEHMQSLLQSEI
jgi:hypothetical protein